MSSIDELDRRHDQAVAGGVRMRLDRADDDQKPLRVYAGPAGHPFCLFVAAGHG